MRKLMTLLIILITSTVLHAQDKDSTAQDYVGKYRFPDGSIVPEVVVSINGDGLTMGSNIGNSALTKISEDLYSLVAYDGTAKFNRDNNKKVVGVTIVAGGYTLEGTRVETKPVPLSLKRMMWLEEDQRFLYQIHKK
jgi:hypothetical protein